jgi:hypothetical protein
MMKTANLKAVFIPLALAACLALPTGCANHKENATPTAAPPIPNSSMVNDPRISPQAREALKKNMALGSANAPKAQ